MKKVLFLFGLFTISLFAKEVIDGYIKEPFLELVQDEGVFYIKNKDAISFKDNIEINECTALNEQNNNKILVTSPFFKGVLIEPSEILKMER